MKLTPQRLAVFSSLDNNHTHPTAESVWEQVKVTMPSVSLRTIYQTLSEMVDLGLVSRVEVGNAVRFDPNTGPHDHFVCNTCEAVMDTKRTGAVAPTDTDLHVTETEVTYRGVCANCQ